ncbi:cupin domain-containing protein [Lewinella sp. LCG006]|uniref:cupin domain-containing protein n=1 Tax=Lewinella sp. LCG006 TaxID=3231911 RepID=UPI0034607921
MEKKEELWVLGHKISPIEVSGNYDMVIGETPGNVPGPPPHIHNGFTELFLVIEGEMEFMVNGVTQVVKQGESVNLPVGALHTFSNSSSSSCKWINVHSPKGFLSFFQEMGIPTTKEEAMKKSIDKSIIDKVIAEAANYDMHIQM